MTQELATRKSIEDIVKMRSASINKYAEAEALKNQMHSAYKEADILAREASQGYSGARFNEEHSDNRNLSESEITRRKVDIDIWASILKMSGIEKLMDKTAKDEFRNELATNPPEITVENVMATMEQLALDSDTIFKRGIATTFSKLDRRFKSHDAWKIGARVILDGAFDQFGSWDYHRNHEATITDIERTFLILEDKEIPDVWNGIVSQINEARKGNWGSPHVCVIESDYFRIRIFKNGNAHVWFTNDNLVEKANKLIAEYYGDVIPDGYKTNEEFEEEAALNNKNMTPAKKFGFFPTPEKATQMLINRAEIDSCLYKGKINNKKIDILEPSAGTGNLIKEILKSELIKFGKIDAYEIQPDLVKQLKSENIANVKQADFLTLNTDLHKKYDAIIMNPPFDRGRDIDHIMQAFKLLKEGGKLTSIMHAGIEFSQTKKAKAFRKLVKSQRGYFTDLPAGSFKESGTNVNTVIVQLSK